MISSRRSTLAAVIAAFEEALAAQGEAADITITVRPFADVASGETALRDDTIDVLVVDAETLEWRDSADPSLQAIATTAIQVSVVGQRAAGAGVDPETMATVLAPVPVSNSVIGAVAGRDADDSAAAFLVTAALLMAIVVYGNLEMDVGGAFIERALGNDRKDDQARELKPEELAKRGIKVADKQESFGHVRFTFLDRVEVQATGRAYWTRTADSFLAAAQLDPRFEKDADFPNRSRSIDRDDSTKRGDWKPYSGSAQYLKVAVLFNMVLVL